MKNRFFKIALLVILPLVAIQADTNITKVNDPFFNDPAFKHFQKMQERMNKIMEEFNKDFFDDELISPNFKSHFGNGFGVSSSPKTDFVDKNDSYELKVDLPGMEEGKIDVSLENHLITIKASNEQKKEDKKGDKIIRQERFVGSVQRVLTLPQDADEKNYKTEYKNGVLTVTIEKKK